MNVCIDMFKSHLQIPKAEKYLKEQAWMKKLIDLDSQTSEG
jgi:hypothetical protein